jgi:repressor LexA
MRFCDRVRSRREELGLSQDELAKKMGYKSRSTINKIELGINDVSQSKIVALAKALNTTIGFLMGDEEKQPSVTVTEDYTTFPVIGDIAAGFDHMAIENWEGETIDVPNSYLKGRSPSDFFVLCVKGDSMFPAYQENDKVLVLRQTTMNYSGQVGAIMYDDDCATLKRIEYKPGEDWLRLVAINPNYPAVMIENERLERCRVLGIPQLLLREINER